MNIRYEEKVDAKRNFRKQNLILPKVAKISNVIRELLLCWNLLLIFFQLTFLAQVFSSAQGQPQFFGLIFGTTKKFGVFGSSSQV
jgi:hypothetical protein